MKNITLLILITSLAGCYGKNPEKTGREGKPVPSFTLLLTDSTSYFTTSNIKPGRPVVLFYFGSHCPFSRAQMEEIIEDMEALKEIKFYLFTSESFAKMKDFYSHYQLNKYPNITVGLDFKNFFSNYFEAKGVPYMAIYGKDLKLKEAFIGKIYGSQIKQAAFD
jgi:thiol-disulfide isomerase/thioredoxin